MSTFFNYIVKNLLEGREIVIVTNSSKFLDQDWILILFWPLISDLLFKLCQFFALNISLIDSQPITSFSKSWRLGVKFHPLNLPSFCNRLQKVIEAHLVLVCPRKQILVVQSIVVSWHVLLGNKKLVLSTHLAHIRGRTTCTNLRQYFLRLIAVKSLTNRVELPILASCGIRSTRIASSSQCCLWTSCSRICPDTRSG